MNFDDDTYFPLKVIRTGPGGKRTFDRAGKRMLVEACLVPGVSISGMALKAGVNANQLHKWIRASQQSPRAAVVPTVEHAAPAFLPVVQIDSAPPQSERGPATAQPPVSSPAPSVSPVRLSARLVNGVAVELECGANDCALVRAMIAALGEQ